MGCLAASATATLVLCGGTGTGGNESRALELASELLREVMTRFRIDEKMARDKEHEVRTAHNHITPLQTKDNIFFQDTCRSLIGSPKPISNPMVHGCPLPFVCFHFTKLTLIIHQMSLVLE
ncbi:hypothetical protein PIB30_023076 [Stylosanthes scabra]|uniref:Uncharacterized protein n=1 Tax=Stylosanthes scabra TaxID=79078 RepID=A0ABU6X6V7_9FABA|nr:hypothetical protein [Stylosanthes scabra]